MILLIAFINLFRPILNKCMTRANCTDIKDLSTCGAPIIDEHESGPKDISDFQCPHMSKDNLCCEQVNSDMLKRNFNLIDGAFGSNGSGTI